MFANEFKALENFFPFEHAAQSIIPHFRSLQGINLWLIMRLAFFEDCTAGAALYTQRNLSFHPEVVRSVSCLPEPAARGLKRLPQGACLIFSCAAIHVERVRGQLYDPYLDPVFQQARQAGLSPVKMALADERLNDALVPVVQVPMVREHALEKPASLPEISCYAEYAEIAVANVCPVIHPCRILSIYNEVESFAGFFQKIIEITRPAVVVLQEYYNRVAMGLALACRRCHVPCIEYQHGMQAGHKFYTFSKMPAEGFEVVPEWFYCWGDKPAQHMEGQFAAQNFHKVAAVGKPSYIAWKNGLTEQTPDLLPRFLKIIEGRIPICVPLPFCCTDEEVQRLAEAIARAPDNWLWLFRQHPLAPCTIAGKLLARFPEKTETELCSVLRLHTVLSHCKHMVFDVSSACHEAVSLHDMRVTCFTAAGNMLYSKVLADNEAAFVESAESLLASIQRGIAGYPHVEQQPTYMTKDLGLLKKALNLFSESRTVGA